MSAYKPIGERLIARGALNLTTHCVEWQGSVDRCGYGKINGGVDMPGETLAHRAAYRCWSGEIPDGHDVDHRCENTRCINPSHLQAIARRAHVEFGDYETNHRNRRKTACLRGHPFDEQNTLISSHDGKPRRYCRACMALRRGRK